MKHKTQSRIEADRYWRNIPHIEKEIFKLRFRPNECGSINRRKFLTYCKDKKQGAFKIVKLIMSIDFTCPKSVIMESQRALSMADIIALDDAVWFAVDLAVDPDAVGGDASLNK